MLSNSDRLREELGAWAQGPARTLSSDETRGVAEALAKVSDADLRGRFAPDEMMALEIYPEIWDRDPAADDTLGFLMERVGQLRIALGAAAARGHGLLVTLT